MSYAREQAKSLMAGLAARLLVTVITLLPISLHAQPEIEIEFVRTFGSLGTAPGQFNSIGGVTVDNAGFIYITDNDNHRIQICDYLGNCETDGSRGTAPGQFQYPIGIAIDQDGRTVVSDGRNFRIQIRNLQGIWSTFGSNGVNVGQFRIPGGVITDAQNQIYVADENNGRIQACNDQGTCTVVATGFITPRAVGIDSQDRLVISDRETNHIHICLPNGACTDFGSTGISPGRFRAPCELWVDREDRIFVADRDNDRFQFCDLQGACVAIGERGSGPGQFNEPTAVAVDNQDRIIIGDSGNNRIQIFQASFPGDSCVSDCSGKECGDDGCGGSCGTCAEDELCNEASICEASCVPDCSDRECGDDGCGGNCGLCDDDALCDADYACKLLDDSAFAINAGMTDAWFDPATSGQGFFITVYEDISTLFLAWFTYDTERPPEAAAAVVGEPGHRWLTAQGPYEGDTANLMVYLTEGGVFDAAEPPAATDPNEVGTITLQFASCYDALLSYRIETLGLEGEIPLERIALDNIGLCEQLASGD